MNKRKATKRTKKVDLLLGIQVLNFFYIMFGNDDFIRKYIFNLNFVVGKNIRIWN